jgi:hypothetical protein
LLVAHLHCYIISEIRQYLKVMAQLPVGGPSFHFQGTIPDQLGARNECSRPSMSNAHAASECREASSALRGMPELTEIESMLRGSAELCQNIVRSLGSSTVALFAVFDDLGKEQLKLAGSGSLVFVGDSHYILKPPRTSGNTLSLRRSWELR